MVELKKLIVFYWFLKKIFKLLWFLLYCFKFCKIIFLLILVILFNILIVYEINWKKYGIVDFIILI